MGQALLCDSCNTDISAANKVSVAVQSLDGGSVQLDFCWECAKPLRRIDAIKEPMRLRREKIHADAARRNAEVMDAQTGLIEIRNDNADVDPDEEVTPVASQSIP